MDRAVAAGASLAARHREPAPPDPATSLLGYAEMARTGDWSLRSALVRMAQPEPVRAGAVLELIRRCDGALRPFARAVESATVWCDRSLTLATVDDQPGLPYADGRVTDLARLCRSAPASAADVLAGYAEHVELTDDERAALPLLGVALVLDDLGDVLARWAASGPDDPPLAAVDSACRQAFDDLADLGVPRETGPPPGARRSA